VDDFSGTTQRHHAIRNCLLSFQWDFLINRKLRKLAIFIVHGASDCINTCLSQARTTHLFSNCMTLPPLLSRWEEEFYSGLRICNWHTAKGERGS
jgi:hypothetical protein